MFRLFGLLGISDFWLQGFRGFVIKLGGMVSSVAAGEEREEEEGRRRAGLGEVLLVALRVVTYIGESVPVRDPK